MPNPIPATAAAACLAALCAVPAAAGEVLEFCIDPGAMRAPVEVRGRDEAFRTFFSAPRVDERNGPYGEWFVLHCPTGGFVKVTGFVATDGNGLVMRPVTAEDMRREAAVHSVTDTVVDGIMGASLADAPALFRDAGLTAEAGRGMGDSCACAVR